MTNEMDSRFNASMWCISHITSIQAELQQNKIAPIRWPGI